ncbi:hypothetical protein ACFHYQ_23450 [Sphaerimonospora cavernae]|uniref:DUF5667 domain-containing protein n=1 Tax=Sphaerimonospora cavernae TaxID=1740611 RepID=A0ABV6UAP5_9ACTN
MIKWGAAGSVMGRWKNSRRVAARVADLGALPGPSPEFHARLRAELLREHAAERARQAAAAPKTVRRRHRHRASRRRSAFGPILVFALLMVGMFATGVRTHHSVPGDLLYPLKRGAESTLLSLAYDDEDLARREMAAAHLRAAETACLLDEPAPRESAPERRRLIAETLDDMDTTTRAALSHVVRDSQTTGEARRFARQQRTLVEPLLPKLDRTNRDKAQQYLSYIDSFAASGQ